MDFEKTEADANCCRKVFHLPERLVFSCRKLLDDRGDEEWKNVDQPRLKTLRACLLKVLDRLK
jgi:hypothetical protein